MQALTNKSIAVNRSPMTIWERLYLINIIKGMLITFSHMFKKQPTVRYPEQKREFSPVFRGLHVLNRDEEGRENCTACGLCAVACPAEEHLYKEEKYAAKYEINMLRCIFCGLCEEACPKDAIYLSETFAPANYTRKGFIYDKNDLLIPNTLTNATELAKAKGVEA